MPHTDGPLYYGFVNIFSMGSGCIFRFVNQGNELVRLYVEPMSLLIFCNEAYSSHLHCIDYYDEDTIRVQIENKTLIKCDIGNWSEIVTKCVSLMEMS